MIRNLEFVFLESPAALIFLCILSLGVVRLGVRIYGVERLRAVWLGLLAVLAFLLGLQAVITTQREAVQRLCHRVAEGVEAGRLAEVSAMLAPGFSAAGLSKAEFVEIAAAQLKRFHTEDLRFKNMKVESTGKDRASAEFTASCRLATVDAGLGPFIVRCRLALECSGGEWRILGIEVLPSPFSPVESVRQLLGR